MAFPSGSSSIRQPIAIFSSKQQDTEPFVPNLALFWTKAKGTHVDLRGKIEQNENFLQQLAKRIPGYQGYLAREQRRDADALLRSHLVDQLQAQRRTVARASAALTERMQLGELDDIARLDKQLERLADLIRYADRGYSGYFDPIKVDEAKLDAVYAFDKSLLDSIAIITTAAAKLAGAAETAAELQPALSETSAAVAATEEISGSKPVDKLKVALVTGLLILAIVVVCALMAQNR